MDLIASEYRGTIQSSPSEQFLQPTGAERFTTLKGMGFPAYKESLISFRNEVDQSPYAVYQTFTNKRVVANNPNSDEHELIRYPEAQHKSAVLEYAHTQAQNSDSLERAAFIEGAAIYLAQPFEDGNKVTARNVYLALRGGWSRSERLGSDLLWATPETKAARMHYAQEHRAMNTINFSDAFLRPEVAELVDRQVYARTGVTKIGAAPQLFGPGESDQTAYERTLSALGDKLWAEDEKELLNLLGKAHNKDAFVDTDFDGAGLQYGLSVLASQGLYSQPSEQEGEEQGKVLHEVLAGLSPEALRGLIAYAWDYHTQQALASIDLLAQDIVIHDPRRGNMTTYDFIRERSAHFEASRVGSKHGALALQTYQQPILERQEGEGDYIIPPNG